MIALSAQHAVELTYPVISGVGHLVRSLHANDRRGRIEVLRFGKRDGADVTAIDVNAETVGVDERDRPPHRPRQKQSNDEKNDESARKGTAFGRRPDGFVLNDLVAARSASFSQSLLPRPYMRGKTRAHTRIYFYYNIQRSRCQYEKAKLLTIFECVDRPKSSLCPQKHIFFSFSKQANFWQPVLRKIIFRKPLLSNPLFSSILSSYRA